MRCSVNIPNSLSIHSPLHVQEVCSCYLVELECYTGMGVNSDPLGYSLAIACEIGLSETGRWICAVDGEDRWGPRLYTWS